LIFLTGQNEISAVCKKLEKKFGRKALEQRRSTKSSYPTDEKEHAKEGDDDRRRQLNPRESAFVPVFPVVIICMLTN
jgi:HrpA-like RNA helicase